MWHPSIDTFTGCNNGSAHSEKETFVLSNAECNVVIFADVYLLVVGVLGILMHAYIIFCYNFKKFEPLMETQALIAGLSVFDLIYCFGLVMLKIFETLPQYDARFACMFYFMFVSLNKNSIFLVVLLLTANRYYAICKHPLRYMMLFSKTRICLYFLVIFIYALIVAFSTQFKYCLDADSTDDSIKIENKLNLYISLFGYILIVLPVMALISFCLVKIRAKLKYQIAWNEHINSLTGTQALLTYDILIEKSYLKAITISTLITLPLLILEFLLSVISMISQISKTSERVLAFLFTAEIAMLSVFSFLYILDPIIFYTTNQDFKLKISKPIRLLQYKISKDHKLSDAVLHTDLN